MNIILRSAVALCLCVPPGAYAAQLLGDDFSKACSGGSKTCHMVSNDKGATWVGPFCGPCVKTTDVLKDVNVAAAIAVPLAGAAKAERNDPDGSTDKQKRGGIGAFFSSTGLAATAGKGNNDREKKTGTAPDGANSGSPSTGTVAITGVTVAASAAGSLSKQRTPDGDDTAAPGNVGKIIGVSPSIAVAAGARITGEGIVQRPILGNDVGTLAKQTLLELADAYGAKRRSAFMKLVSPDFSGDVSTFEEALVKDFRDYRTVNLRLTPDKVLVQDGTAAVEFHYDLTVVNEQGVNKTFSGRSNYAFREEEGKIRLYKMEKPIIFGNSLTATENPIDAGQHSLSAAGSSAPGLQSTLRGSAIVASFPCISSLPGAAFKFETQSRKAFDSSGLDRSADIFRNGAGKLEALSGGAIASIGNCSLDSVTSVPGMVSGNSATPNVGECYAFKTGPGKYAVLRVNSVELALSGCALEFSYKYQPSGSNAF